MEDTCIFVLLSSLVNKIHYFSLFLCIMLVSIYNSVIENVKLNMK